MNCQCRNSAIRFCICCEAVSCRQGENKSSEQNGNNQTSNQIIASIENNFAILLQKQLRILSDRKEKQISSLEGIISQLKIEIIKLESRNKLDKENENRLKQQVKKQANKIRELQEISEKFKLISERKQTVIIKQDIKRPQIRPDVSFPEIQRLKQDLVKVRTEKYEFQEMNKYLSDKISDMQKLHKNEIQKLRNRIEQLQKQLDGKNRDFTELSKRSIELQQKLTILSKPTRLNIQPIIIQKVTSLPPEIRTVYIDKPVQRTKLVQVQKIIKHFIQPQRPIVNRIIECSTENKYTNKTNRCCQDQQNYGTSEEVNINIKQYQIRNKEYESVIDSYKSQRDKMLKAIQSRDSDYRLLEKKMELIQKVNYKAAAKCGHGEKIEVTVVKHDEENDILTDSDKKGTKQGKTTGIKGTSKNTYTKTEQNVRKR